MGQWTVRMCFRTAILTEREFRHPSPIRHRPDDDMQSGFLLVLCGFHAGCTTLSGSGMEDITASLRMPGSSPITLDTQLNSWQTPQSPAKTNTADLSTSPTTCELLLLTHFLVWIDNSTSPRMTFDLFNIALFLGISCQIALWIFQSVIWGMRVSNQQRFICLLRFLCGTDFEYVCHDAFTAIKQDKTKHGLVNACRDAGLPI